MGGRNHVSVSRRSSLIGTTSKRTPSCSVPTGEQRTPCGGGGRQRQRGGGSGGSLIRQPDIAVRRRVRTLEHVGAQLCRGQRAHAREVPGGSTAARGQADPADCGGGLMASEDSARRADGRETGACPRRKARGCGYAVCPRRASEYRREGWPVDHAAAERQSRVCRVRFTSRGMEWAVRSASAECCAVGFLPRSGRYA